MEKAEAVKIAYNECQKVCDDEFLLSKLNTCLEFLNNKISVGEARKKAFECHKYARELKDKKQILLARACGHAIACCHTEKHLKPCLDYLEKYKQV